MQRSAAGEGGAAATSHDKGMIDLSTIFSFTRSHACAHKHTHTYTAYVQKMVEEGEGAATSTDKGWKDITEVSLLSDSIAISFYPTLHTHIYIYTHIYKRNVVWLLLL